MARPEHCCLAGVIESLRPVKQHFPEVSWADLIAVAGAVAVAQANGPAIGVRLGRKDADTPAPRGKALSPDLPIAELRARFEEVGFTVQDMVALSGAHTLGRVDGVPFHR